MSLEAAVRSTHGELPRGIIYRHPVARKHSVLPVTFVMSKTSVVTWTPNDAGNKRCSATTLLFLR